MNEGPDHDIVEERGAATRAYALRHVARLRDRDAAAAAALRAAV